MISSIVASGGKSKRTGRFPAGGTDDSVDFGDWDGGSLGEVIVSLLIVQPG
jgi:hypothetical protein